MIPVKCDHPPGTIAVVAADRPRYFECLDALMATQVPPYTHFIRISQYNVAAGRNLACQQATGDWVWFIDDDHNWAPDTLINLLNHRVDVVGPLVARCYPPFQPQAFIQFDGEHFEDNYLHNWDTLQLHLDMGETLLDVPALGTPGLLVRRPVWDALQPYPFEWPHKDSNKVTEDTWFTWKAHQAGFKVCVDLTIPFPHLTTLAVYAYAKNGVLKVCGGIGNEEMTLQTAKRTIVPDAVRSPAPDTGNLTARGLAHNPKECYETA